MIINSTNITFDLLFFFKDDTKLNSNIMTIFYEWAWANKSVIRSQLVKGDAAKLRNTNVVAFFYLLRLCWSFLSLFNLKNHIATESICQSHKRQMIITVCHTHHFTHDATGKTYEIHDLIKYIIIASRCFKEGVISLKDISFFFTIFFVVCLKTVKIRVACSGK